MNTVSNNKSDASDLFAFIRDKKCVCAKTAFA